MDTFNDMMTDLLIEQDDKLGWSSTTSQGLQFMIAAVKSERLVREDTSNVNISGE